MTALAATFQAPTATRPPRVLLQVTGAPNPPANAYASNFATVDGWTGASAAIVLGNLRLSGPLSQPVNTVTTGQRTLTGLSVGAQYRYRAFITTQSDTQARLRISGGVSTAYVATLSTGAWVELLFTATATSHIIMVDLKNTTANAGPIVDVTTVTVQPSGTWQGTTIRRSDVNGSNVVVREDTGGMDTSGGTMTLYDLEAALVGPVMYTVTDGAGDIAYATTAASGAWQVNMVPNPGFELSTVTGWQAQGTSTTLARDTSEADTGSAVGLVTTGTDNAAALRTLLLVLPVVAGRRYVARARIRSTGSDPVYLAIRYLAADGSTTTAYVNGVAAPANTGGYVTFTVDGLAPALSAFARVYVFRNGVTNGQVIRADSVLMREAAIGEAFDPSDYWDGSYPGAVWMGTPNSSPSARALGESSAGVWLTIPASSTPSLGTAPAVPAVMVLAYDESSASNGSLHEIVGRADPIANPGPLSLRQGSLEIFCVDYPTAVDVRQLLASGDVAQLRQPDYPGMDMYFTAQDVRIAPADDVTDPRRWIVTLSYAEVLAA